MAHAAGIMALVDDAKQRIQEVSVTDVKDMQEQQKDFILIDTREESEWNMHHLPQASHMSRGVLEFKIEQAIPNKDTDIILYCGGGYRSALAADNLQKMGYKNVASMAGGYRDWQQAGYELTS
jgi:rhodanese-related sulfurtransferase